MSRTHCLHGHEFTPENTYVDSRGKRLCRICRRDAQREAYSSVRRTYASDWAAHPELDRKLEQLVLAGLTARRIAEILGHGLTRNAVIGRASRLGFTTAWAIEKRKGMPAPPPPEPAPAPPVRLAIRTDKSCATTGCRGTRQPGKAECAECERARLSRNPRERADMRDGYTTSSALGRWVS